MINFKNKVVWITGASSGIGEALCKEFAKKGSRLILSSRNENELIRVKKNLNLTAEYCVILPLDLAEHTSLNHKVEQAINSFGRIDCMVHNGGISQRSITSETSLEVDRKIFNVNFWGAVILTKALLPYFIKQKEGQFILISSLAGKFGSKLRSSYSASKHALHGYFESMRYDHWQDGIKVLMVCPGFIRTNISLNALKGDGSINAKMDESQNKGISPEKCASKIVYAAEKNKEEITVGGKEILSVYLKRFFPSILSRLMKNIDTTTLQTSKK